MTAPCPCTCPGSGTGGGTATRTRLCTETACAASFRANPDEHFCPGKKKPTWKRWACEGQPFGGSSEIGLAWPLFSYQPPPRALYRLTSLVSCDRRSLISDCWALNNERWASRKVRLLSTPMR